MSDIRKYERFMDKNNLSRPGDAYTVCIIAGSLLIRHLIMTDQLLAPWYQKSENFVFIQGNALEYGSAN